MASKKRSNKQAASLIARPKSRGTPRDPLPPAPADGAPTQPAPDNNSTMATCAALTDETCDLVAELSEMLKANLALERFISPEHEDECQANVQPSRADLGALLHAVNLEIQRLMRALSGATMELQRHTAVGR